jgi:hypothetical protein
MLALVLTLAVSTYALASVSSGRARLVVRDSSVELGFQPFASTSDPAASIAPSQPTFTACDAAPDSAACISAALSDINNARAGEGVGPMQLPRDFASLTVQQQLLVVTNLERVDRGLTPVAGLAADLDSAAANAAAADQDPMINHFNGNQLASNWAGGMSSTLLTDFVWMYDDGAGSGNLDCQQLSNSGCWGHRNNILYRFDNPVAMGVGYRANTSYGPSMTELFIGSDSATGPGEADSLLAPTWVQLSGQPSKTTPPSPTEEPASVTQVRQVSRASTSFRIRLGRTSIRRGQWVTVAGQLRCAGHVVAGQLVTLVRLDPGSTTNTVVASTRAHTGGRVSFHVSPRANAFYTIVFWGSRTLAASSSGVVEIRVGRSRYRSR